LKWSGSIAGEDSAGKSDTREWIRVATGYVDKTLVPKISRRSRNGAKIAPHQERRLNPDEFWTL